MLSTKLTIPNKKLFVRIHGYHESKCFLYTIVTSARNLSEYSYSTVQLQLLVMRIRHKQ